MMIESVSDEEMMKATYAHRLEIIALALESRPGNEVYRKAWKIAARVVRVHKHHRAAVAERAPPTMPRLDD